MLAVITFLYAMPPEWQRIGREPYTARHVNALYRAVGANLSVPHRFVCLTDQPEGIACETMPVWPAIKVGGQESCYRKVRAFDRAFQESLGSQILCLDLDAAVVGNLDPLITDDEFRIMRGSENRLGQQCSFYNGSMWLCRSGARTKFWEWFDPPVVEQARANLIMPTGKRVEGSDQAWFSCCSPGEKVYTADEHGVVQYHMVRRGAFPFPKDARIVFFAGQRKPWGRLVKQSHPDLAAAWARYDVDGQGAGTRKWSRSGSNDGATQQPA